MEISKEEIDLFGDGKGNIDIVSLLAYRVAKEKGDKSDYHLIRGELELVELL